MIKLMKEFIAETFTGPVITTWLLLLMLANMIIPLFFLGRIEAQITLLCMVIAFSLGMILFKIQGHTRLLGLMHFPWIGLVIFLWIRLAQVPANDLFGLWVRAVIILDLISLSIDIPDVIRYIIGDRT